MIHNDFRFDNMVLDADDPMRVVGVLDWEMATVGDPLMDLGGTLSYWVEPGDDEFFQMFRRQPTTTPGMWTRDQVVEHYCDRMGFEMTPERWRFYEVFGLFRLAVIAQQIWYRYFHKQTTNEAYAVFGPGGRLPRDPLPVADSDGAGAAGPARPGVVRCRRLRRAVGDRLGAGAAARRLAGRARRDADARSSTETCAGSGTPRAAMAEGAGWSGIEPDVDPGWDEFDHVGMVAAYPDLPPTSTSPTAARSSGLRAGHRALDGRRAGRLHRDVRRLRGPRASLRWTARPARPAAGRHRGRGELRRPDRGRLLRRSSTPTARRAWQRFNTVIVNSSVSRVVVGSTGARLLTFNEHPHLEGDHLTYR